MGREKRALPLSISPMKHLNNSDLTLKNIALASQRPCPKFVLFIFTGKQIGRRVCISSPSIGCANRSLPVASRAAPDPAVVAFSSADMSRGRRDL
jgi:hypothetical protein